jgi:N-methylhydantoinase A/oxoprolinase/acetone carboxylase beta subunit
VTSPAFATGDERSANQARIGVDVGGTFTDAVAVDPSTGEVRASKTATTPSEVVVGTRNAVDALGADLKEVDAIVHGTTLVTNALVERNTPLVALVTTAGFRDSLEIRRALREHLYDITWRKPAALVKRQYRFEVLERVDRDGNVLIPLDEEGVRRVGQRLAELGIAHVAICFLFSFRNASHEMRARVILKEVLPDAKVSISFEILPEFREYERTSTTVLNAMARGVMEDYLDDLGQMLRDRRFNGELRIMKADGGVANAAYIARRSVEAFHSGPAGGVTAAAELGRVLGRANILTLDMGGTTTDVSLIWNGEPVLTMEQEVAFGLPVRIPMIYVRSIGAGGGSIAWLDDGGGLRVGPRSAGAIPGPACYERGGTEATVTDAMVALGYVDPNFFLGGSMQLNRDLATKAVGIIADRFGWSVAETASAISRIALANMCQAIREVSVERGYDPRDFVLLAFGGAGPLFAAAAAAELGIKDVIIPERAGVFSALGCLHADFKNENVKTVLLIAVPGCEVAIDTAWRELTDKGFNDLGSKEAVVQRFIDMRYVGEAYELTVSVPQELKGWRAIEAAVGLFHSEHRRLYGFERTDRVEIVNARVRVVLPVPRPRWVRRPAASSTANSTETVTAVLPDGSSASVPTYHRGRLSVGQQVEGPAIVQDPDATTVIYERQALSIDEFGNIRIATGSAPPGSGGSRQ